MEGFGDVLANYLIFMENLDYVGLNVGLHLPHHTPHPYPHMPS